MRTVRLFIALDIPSEIKSHIAALISDLKSVNADVRWEQIEKLHITLKFLGDTEEAKVPDILSSLNQIAASTPTFTITYSALGCFPHKGEPRTIWIGVNDIDSALKTLAESIETRVASLGFERERKGFHSHVTIGRVKNQHNVRDLLRRMESITFQSQPAQVSRIVLIKSELGQGGSVYTTLKEIPLLSQQNTNY